MSSDHTRNNCPYNVEIANFNASMKSMKEDIQDIKLTVRDLATQIHSMPDRMDKLYARKDELVQFHERVAEVRNVVYGGLAAILLAALGFALKTIFGW